MTTRFLCVLVLFAIAAPARAGLELTYSPSTQTVVADASFKGAVTYDVRAAASSGTQSLKAYDLFVDLAAPTGTGLSAGWSVGQPVDVVRLSNGVFFSTSPPGVPTAGDVYAGDVSLSGSGIQLTTTPTTLWTFTVSFDGYAGARDGDFAANFLTTATNPAAVNFGLKDGDANPITDFTISSATVKLQGFDAVPEPSTFALVAIASLGAAATGAWKRRRRPASP